MRKIKLLFVENDEALRGLLAALFATSEKIQLLGAFANASDVLKSGLVSSADAALLDHSLDPEGLNGVELGVQLRNMNEHIGIVIYSQFSVAPMVRRVPKSMLSGWSFLQKSATATLAAYTEAIQTSISGKGNWPEIVDLKSQDLRDEASLFFRLTPRQRTILALAAKSHSAREISTQLDLSYVYVRAELSRAYKVLLPDAKDSDDLKTAAILKYLDLMKATQ